jgi:hypothetical protein
MMKNSICCATIVVIIASAAQFAGLMAARADDQEERKMPLTSPTAGTNADPSRVANTELTTQTQSDDGNPPATTTLQRQNRIIIQSVEPDGKKERAKEFTWLGLAVEESSEALSSQLGLKPGEGLTVNFLAIDSPAAKADFHKNDVLVEMDGQMLVHPLQLRKLVQMHAEGDTVNLTFYRGGKKQTVSVKLGKMSWDQAFDKEDGPLPDDLPDLPLQMNGLHGELRGMGDSLARAGMDKAKVNIEIQRTMEQARKAIQDSVRRASTDQKFLTIVDRKLEALARNGVDVDKDATVTVRKKRNSDRTIVQTDENGTLIIEAGAKKHLTARDKDGQLLFDGDIDTPEERERVPKAVWEKVQPFFK